jgi:hypothetical protein
MQIYIHKSSSAKNDKSRKNISKLTGNVFSKWDKDLWVQYLIYQYALPAFTKKMAIFSRKIESEMKKPVKFYIWSIALYGAETGTLRAVDQKHLESYKMWCWRRMEKIIWTDHVRNEEVLLRVKTQRNILHEISKRKANWIGHILCRNCLLQQVIERKIKGGIEVKGRRERRRRNLLDELRES